MRQTHLALLRNRIRKIVALFRISYFKLQGLDIKKGSTIGSIKCQWPKNIKIGNASTLQNNITLRINHPFSEFNVIEIGDRVFIGEYCSFNCASKITVGNDTLIAANTMIIDVTHEYKLHMPIAQQPIVSKEIIIGDDVWIGAGSIILAGVTIGNGSIIGAGSIVNKSVPPYEVWAGSPARFIFKRT